MYRVAVIGYRLQGSRHHAPGFANHPDCEIAAVCDIDEERARAGADLYRVPFYLDAREMLDREKIDITAIPVGEQYRFDLVMECLRREKHVYTEKPLAGEEGQNRIKMSDIPRARAMIDEWLKHDVQFGVCFPMHVHANALWAMDVIRDKQCGKLKTIQGRTSNGSWNHLVDMVRFLGGEFEEVSAYGSDDLSSKAVSARLENGVLGTLLSSDVALQYQIKWFGDRGEVQIDNIAGTARARYVESCEFRYFTEEGALYPTTYEAGFRKHIAEFVESIKGKKLFNSDGWAGLRHMEIEGAVTESSTSGRPVKVRRYMPEKGRTIHSAG